MPNGNVTCTMILYYLMRINTVFGFSQEWHLNGKWVLARLWAGVIDHSQQYLCIISRKSVGKSEGAKKKRQRTEKVEKVSSAKIILPAKSGEAKVAKATNTPAASAKTSQPPAAASTSASTQKIESTSPAVGNLNIYFEHQNSRTKDTHTIKTQS